MPLHEVTNWRDDPELNMVGGPTPEAAVMAYKRWLTSEIETTFGQEREVLLYESAYHPSDVKTSRTTMATVRRVLKLIEQGGTSASL